MPLPVIKHPTFDITIPSTKEVITFRPILVSEERILLTARESNALDDVLRAVKQIIKNCSTKLDLDVDRLAIFDIEWVFLQLRRFSISNTISLEYEDSEDGQTYAVKFDIAEVQMPAPPADVNFDLKVDGDISVKLTWPNGVIYGDNKISSDLDRIAASCIKSVYAADSITPVENTEETFQWVQTFSVQTHEELMKFFEKIPIITHKVSYTTAKGTVREITLEGLSDFFGFR
jgi:hypothetical protein